MRLTGSMPVVLHPQTQSIPIYKQLGAKTALCNIHDQAFVTSGHCAITQLLFRLIQRNPTHLLQPTFSFDSVLVCTCTCTS